MGYGAPHPTLDGWKALLDQLLAIGTGKVYVGRGDFLRVAEAAQQIAYVDKPTRSSPPITHGVNDGPGIWWAFLL
ncbi:hypothetical protein, partial [Mesorhizobium sp. LNJC394B00]|uniref:hypothetical protein n=2 Tax=unclassified Mesorhizobium TaxID=325217 RepID=UPI000518C14E